MKRITIALTCILTAVLLSAPVVAATGVPACVAFGQAEGEFLYFCESDYADCVWDPSPALGAGVMDCD